MRRLGLLVACLALVGAACSGGGDDEVRASTRSTTTTAPTLTTTTTSTTSTTAPPVVTTVAPSTTAAPASQPSQGSSDPAPAATGGNGQLADSSLTTITASCRILTQYAGQLQALLNAARADGIALWPETQPYTTGAVPPRLTSCYRDHDMQQWWRDYYCGQGSCGYAAVPGTSVHGWGRAVDFEQGGQELEFGMSGYEWLVAHASAFGFAQPGWAQPSGGSPEPWHWEAQ